MKEQQRQVKHQSFFSKAIESRKNALRRNDEHHLEFAAEVNGVTYINDARSIRVSSTCFSIECIEAPIILIMGGDDLENEYSTMLPAMKNYVEAIIYLGK